MGAKPASPKKGPIDVAGMVARRRGNDSDSDSDWAETPTSTRSAKRAPSASCTSSFCCSSLTLLSELCSACESWADVARAAADAVCSHSSFSRNEAKTIGMNVVASAYGSKSHNGHEFSKNAPEQPKSGHQRS